MITYNTTYNSDEQLNSFIKKHKIDQYNEIFLQVFSGIIDEKLLSDLIFFIQSLIPQIKIIGSTTDGEIVDGEVYENSISLSFSIFEKSYVRIYETKINNNSSDMALDLINQIENPKDAKVVIAFADGLITNGEDFVGTFRERLPNLTISGGLSGDNAEFKKTIILTNNGVLYTSAIAVIYGDSLNLHTSYNFGWEEIGKKLTITKAQSNRVYTIDNIPAVDIYNKYLGENIGKQLPVTGIEFPLILQRDGYKIARAAISKHLDGSMTFAGDLKEQEIVSLGYGNIDNILNERHKLYSKIQSQPVESIFVYSCMARKRLLKSEIGLEILPLCQIAPTSGFFTYGEFYYCNKDTKNCQNHLFNETMTILTLSENSSHKEKKLDIKMASHENIQTIKALTYLVNTTTQELQASKDNMKQYLQLVDENIITSTTDLNGIITDVSEAFCKVSGFTKEELIGSNHNIVRHPSVDEELFQDLWGDLKANKTWRGEIKNKTKDGGYYWVDATIYPNFDKNGEKTSYTAIRQNITDKKIIEEISITDGLTNIFNRRHFNDIFPKIINGAKRDNNIVCLIIMDIDHFKQYNDTYGHQEGDQVLKEVALTIQNTLKRSDDYCFRLGGEEFGIVFKVDKKDQAIQFGEKIRKNIESLKIKHLSSSVYSSVTVSMGMMVQYANNITNGDTIYKETDQLLYKAKNSGRNRLVYIKGE